MTVDTTSPARPTTRRSGRVPAPGYPLTLTSGLGLGVAVLWFSLLVLIPLLAILVSASSGGWSAFWAAVTQTETASAIRLTVITALAVTVVNVIMGTIIAWVLVRDRFPGQRLIEFFIDIPLALPTIVIGLVLLSLYGPKSPLGWNVTGTRASIVIAFLFVTLPFVVRAVQPVLAELDREAEEAAASLGAGRFTIFRRVVLPALAPAIAAGAALSFARAVAEYASLVLITGDLPNRTEVASVRIIAFIQGDREDEASAVAAVLLVVTIVVVVVVDLLQRRAVRRG